MAKDDDVLAEGREAYEAALDAMSHNHETGLADIKFSRLQEQWPEEILRQRREERRPALTIDKTQAFKRQVVNDARQNKPQIKVQPVDSQADPETAEVFGGIIRSIETSSNADAAYDTGVEHAVECGFGYWRVGLDYAYADAATISLSIDRIANPFSVLPDPNSTEVDSSDWNDAFIAEEFSKKEFEKKYDSEVGWDDSGWTGVGEGWKTENSVVVTEWWHREEVEKPIVITEDGKAYDKEQLETDPDLIAAVQGRAIVPVRERMSKGHKVTQRIMTGAEILEENDWLGCFIPIVPVYGDDFFLEGKRYLRSLIHPAIDAQRMYNFQRTAGVEMLALTPRVPWIGPEGAFSVDTEKWNTANSASHQWIEYSGQVPVGSVQRQPLDMGAASGAIREALMASDDMKAILGMYDASLGNRSNETSGRAILARQREGDVSTFHFIDNLSRAIRHTGRILIDLIPKVYDAPMIVRTIGEDGAQKAVPVNQQYPAQDREGKPRMQPDGNPILAMHQLGTGKYDIRVSSGPSFTTRREEAAMQMTELIRAFPQAAPLVSDLLAKNLDWPGADEIAERFKELREGPQSLPPQVQQMIQKGMERIKQLEGENTDLKQNLMVQMKKIEADTENKRAQIMSDEQIAVEQIASKERIAQMQIESDKRIAAMRAAQPRPQAA